MWLDWSVQSVAEKYASMPEGATGAVKSKAIYDFYATCGNVATVVTVASVALALFTGSVLLYALAALAFAVRGEFHKEVKMMATGFADGYNGVEKKDKDGIQVDVFFGVNRSNEISNALRAGLDIEDKNWSHIALNLIWPIWLNTTPSAAQTQEASQQPDSMPNREADTNADGEADYVHANLSGSGVHGNAGEYSSIRRSGDPLQL